MKKVYLIGICGTGMSSLAGLFKEAGYFVGGSDKLCFPPIKNIIESLKVETFYGFNSDNIRKFAPDFVIIGNIVGRGNPEGEYVLNNQIPYMSMAEALWFYFLKNKKRIVVAGTHGKTTTTGFLAYSLSAAGFEPGYFIGGKPIDLQSNYHIGNGAYFIIEGDEYETAFFDKKSKFFHYYPNDLILKRVEYDHADIFSSENEYIVNFKNLIKQVPSKGDIFFNADCPNSVSLLNNSYSKNIIYGTNEKADIKYNILHNKYPYEYEVEIDKQNLGKFRLNLLGEYNIENSLPSVYYLYKNGITLPEIKKIISEFKGMERRQQILFNSKDIIYIDDFAHHPTAIEKTIKSIKNSFQDRTIITIFEPASWSLRKNIFQKELEQALSYSDIIFILDIKGKEKIPVDKRLNLNKLGAFLNSGGKIVKLFIDKKNNSESILKELSDTLKSEQQNPKKEIVILTLSNGKRLSLNEKIPAYVNRRCVDVSMRS